MSIPKDKKILIVGLGLIGGSYAKRLKEQGFYVSALTKCQDDINYALENNIIDEGMTIISKDFISMHDIIIFSLYPKIFVKWIEENQQFLKKNALLTDVTGIKGAIVHKVQKKLRKDLEFVPAHPMAGKESSGVQNSSSTLFKGANFIITPTKKNKKTSIDYIRGLARVLGFKNISVLSVKEHDEMIAFLSQLTHCIAISLMTCSDKENLFSLCGDSFRDLTRIAKINEKMWSELFLLNKKELLIQMNKFEKQFSILKKAIRKNDVDTIEKIMISSRKKKEIF